MTDGERSEPGPCACGRRPVEVRHNEPDPETAEAVRRELDQQLREQRLVSLMARGG